MSSVLLAGRGRASATGRYPGDPRHARAGHDRGV